MYMVPFIFIKLGLCNFLTQIRNIDTDYLRATER